MSLLRRKHRHKWQNILARPTLGGWIVYTDRCATCNLTRIDIG